MAHLTNQSCRDFAAELASKASVPGGGGPLRSLAHLEWLCARWWEILQSGNPNMLQ